MGYGGDVISDGGSYPGKAQSGRNASGPKRPSGGIAGWISFGMLHAAFIRPSPINDPPPSDGNPKPGLYNSSFKTIY
jgi:hypothetical protein